MKTPSDQNNRDKSENSPENNLKSVPGKRPATLNDADSPIVAAKGDDDLMSQKQQPKKTRPQPQQQPQSMASTDAYKGKWKQHVGAAKVAWGKLTDDELLQTEGHAQKLTGLVQQRYAISRDEANKQVEKFITSHKL